MNRVTIKHGFTATFTNTITRAVGPTTSTTARDLSDAVGPYVYLARNGSNANTGLTALDPKLTLDGLTGAIATLGTSGRNTIHIITNGYTTSPDEQGYLTFVATGLLVIPAGKGIQVELGAKARIRAVAAGNGLALSTNGYINGIAYTNTFEDGMIVQTGCTISWCYILGGTTRTNPNKGITAATGAITVQYSIIHAYRGLFEGTSQNNVVNNCVFISPTPQISSAGTVTPTEALEVSTTGAGTTTTFTRCVFVGWTNLVLQLGTVANLKTVTFNACSAYNTLYAVSTATTGVVTLNYNFCHILPVAQIFNYTTMSTVAPAGFTLAESNAVDPKTPALYRDYATAILPFTIVSGVSPGFRFPNLDVDGLRLQRRGASTSMGGTQYVDSPLIDLYTGPSDVAGPWTETVTGPIYDFPKTTIIQHPAHGLQLSAVIINPVSLDDLLGNYNSNFDAIIRQFQFTFDYDIYPGHDDRIKLVKLLNDRNVMKLFLKGEYGNLFVTPTCNGIEGPPSATTGTFTATSTTQGTFVPFITDSNAMIETNWKGLLLEISGYGEYYIEANDDTTFTILDLFSSGLPSNGVHPFFIRAILVKPVLNNLESTQENFTSFMFGGGLREYTQLPGRPGSLPHEYSGHSITFLETTNLRQIPS